MEKPPLHFRLSATGATGATGVTVRLVRLVLQERTGWDDGEVSPNRGVQPGPGRW